MWDYVGVWMCEYVDMYVDVLICVNVWMCGYMDV